jgi:diacylglycerol kinase (ATP)
VTAVATGVLEAGADVTIGIVPLGTGNGLARVLRLPMDPGRAIAAMAGGRVVPLDVVRVDAPRCIALFFLGAGLDAEINRDADTESKARFGFLAYLGATARNLLGRRNHRVELTVDGRTEMIAAHTVTVFNAGQFAFAGLEVGPDVDPHDGELDLTVMRSPGFWPSLAAVLRLATGQPHAAASRRGRRFRIDAQPPLLVHVDGDVIGTTPLEGEALPGALAFIAAAEYPAERRHAAGAVERDAAPARP